jgi:hypothetical protein
MADKQTTKNSRCPIHQTHNIRYCPDAGHVPGKSRGSTDGLLATFKKQRAEALQVHQRAADHEKLIRDYQARAAAGEFHPLTCGKDSSHKPLEPASVHGELGLACEDCDYTQVGVPGAVLEAPPKAVDEPKQ